MSVDNEASRQKATKRLKVFIRQLLEASYMEGYKKGVSDEIECIETSGEHADLRSKLSTLKDKLVPCPNCQSTKDEIAITLNNTCVVCNRELEVKTKK